MISTYTSVYTRTHTSVFVSDNIRNVLRDIIRENGHNPTQLMDSWSSTLGNAARYWLETGDLTNITIEFYQLGSDIAEARWDFPVTYDGSGADDDMWVSKRHILSAIAKASKPSANALYRIILRVRPGAPDVEGMGDAELKSTEGLVCRFSGTAIATPDIMAGIKYWRAT